MYKAISVLANETMKITNPKTSAIIFIVDRLGIIKAKIIRTESINKSGEIS
jgi:hypothetical protein